MNSLCIFARTIQKHAGVVELVDTLDLGSSAARRGGSTPFTRTKKPSGTLKVFLCFEKRWMVIPYLFRLWVQNI